MCVAFWTHAGAFRCTDIGTRVVVPVKLGPREIGRPEKLDGELRITKRIDDDPSWLNGPPYAVEEVAFDENELLGCFRTEAASRPIVVATRSQAGRKSLQSSTRAYRDRAQSPSNEIGCILLAQPTFFQPDEWVEGPSNWPPAKA